MYLHPRDLEYFLVIVSHGRLSSAAAELGVTQPALSKVINRLEMETGLLLFERGIHGVRLTGVGQEFKQSVLDLQTQHHYSVSLINELKAKQAGILRVGTTSVSREALVVKTLSILMARRPAMRVRLVSGQSDWLCSEIEEGRLDLAVVPSYPGLPFNCEQQILGKDQMLPVVRQFHPLARNSSLKIQDLEKMPWALGAPNTAARRTIISIYKAHGMSGPPVSLEMTYVTESLLSLIASTDVIGLIPQNLFRRPVADMLYVLPVKELHIDRLTVLLSRNGAQWTPLMESFQQLLKIGSTT
ncbi:LysR family transcriptional regulator [Candidimonas nitroreducens]|uniref:LysR family transcriptional regulator n=1 Tax=Candidimonas nitroreducens TaxID=683354 RepID=A0A225MAB0_9BURK|nr:LysR family transcriptional regulator [Candidimonas nitroreducens]OWT58245.1 LysR family transcriptional regulator [Candidimonas nitroreducens]